jgi:hypothetical protein
LKAKNSNSNKELMIAKKLKLTCNDKLVPYKLL